MVFSSNEFVFVFLPLAILSNLLLLGVLRAKGYSGLWAANLLLLLFSLVFYAWGGPKHLPLLVGSAIVNYFGALLVAPTNGRRTTGQKIRLSLLITINISALCVFKYLNFFQEAGGLSLLNSFLPDRWRIAEFAHIALPVGISFYIFQAISYLVDVYRGDIHPCRSFVNFACYLTMFPQLIAGPIVRFSDIHTDLEARKIGAARVSKGCARFIFGLSKKLLLADTFGRVVDTTFALPPDSLNAGHAWLGIACYTLQIYFDFSAYSDMAIGIGNMLGIGFLENFNYPYISTSIRDFWRRWHISLSTWFRDYLYIPLGGNRKGATLTAINLLIVFILCGLWHGAAWNFILWGAYHGFFLIIERIVPKTGIRVPRIFKHSYTLFIVMIGWVLFRADTLPYAIEYLRALFGCANPDASTINVIRMVASGYVLPICLCAGVVLSAPVFPLLRTRLTVWYDAAPRQNARRCMIALYRCFLFALLALCIGAISSNSYQSFIYFRF